MTRTLLMLYLAVLLFSVTAFADSNAVFTNQLGTLFSKKSGTSNYFLQMGTPGTNTGSALNQITGAAGLNCGGLLPACSGNVAWITPLTSKAGVDNVALGFGGVTSLGAGGQFTIFETGGDNGGLVFVGTFTNALWSYIGTCTVSGCAAGQYYQWQLVGSVSGIFYANGQQMMVSGSTFESTTQKFTKGDPFKSGTGSISFAGGTSTLPGVAPEPGTLALLGTGLVGIGLLAKRRLSSHLRG